MKAGQVEITECRLHFLPGHSHPRQDGFSPELFDFFFSLKWEEDNFILSFTKIV